MDVQIISVATAVVSSAIAALGLTLTWYRREGGKEGRKRQGIFITVAVGIVVLTAVGVMLTFILGTDTRDSIGADYSSSTSGQLTETQYKGRVGVICSNAHEKARRLVELRPQESVIGPAVQIEEDELAEIKKLWPPDKLKRTHEDMISVWQRRVSLIESIDRGLPHLSDSELDADIAEVEQLTDQLTTSFKKLDVLECVV